MPAAAHGDRRSFRLAGVSIVNGAQTAGAITSAALSGRIGAEAKLLITVVEIGSADEMGVRITRARNHQNAVRGIDFAALDPVQERLRRELALVGTTYHYRASEEARVRGDDACTLEEAAVALACTRYPVLSGDEVARRKSRRQTATNAVELVVTARVSLGRLWEQEGGAYAQLFGGDLSAMHLWRSVLVYRQVDAILAERERAATAYHERAFYRNSRPFCVALVVHRSRELVDGHALPGAADRVAVSRITDEVSALAYVVAESWRVSKGYRAFFRSLTDVQLLANTVLERFAEVDARVNAPAPAEPAR